MKCAGLRNKATRATLSLGEILGAVGSLVDQRKMGQEQTMRAILETAMDRARHKLGGSERVETHKSTLRTE